MREFRMGRNVTEHYSSFEDMRAAWGCKPVKKKTDDKVKLEKQQSDFCEKHLCKACKSPMTYVGGNIMTCTNDKCKGIKIEKEGKDGEKIISYITSYELLDTRGAEIANNIFS